MTKFRLIAPALAFFLIFNDGAEITFHRPPASSVVSPLFSEQALSSAALPWRTPLERIKTALLWVLATPQSTLVRHPKLLPTEGIDPFRNSYAMVDAADGSGNGGRHSTFVDLSKIPLDEIPAVFDTMVPPRTLILANAEYHKLGEAVALLPIVIKSFLRTWPGLTRMQVVTDFPEVLEGLDPRVQVFTSESHLPPETPDIWIDYKSSPGRRARRSPTLITSFSHQLRLGSPITTHQDLVHQNLARMGFRVPERTIGFLERSTRRPVIFVNIHSQTNHDRFQGLITYWLGFILWLLESGFDVELNQGNPRDDHDKEMTARVADDLRRLVDRYRQEIDLRHFRIRSLYSIKDLKDYIGQVGGVVTIDNAVFHLARLYDTPVLVLTTARSRFWVPLVEDLFGAIPMEPASDGIIPGSRKIFARKFLEYIAVSPAHLKTQMRRFS